MVKGYSYAVDRSLLDTALCANGIRLCIHCYVTKNQHQFCYHHHHHSIESVIIRSWDIYPGVKNKGDVTVGNVSYRRFTLFVHPKANANNVLPLHPLSSNGSSGNCLHLQDKTSFFQDLYCIASLRMHGCMSTVASCLA